MRLGACAKRSPLRQPQDHVAVSLCLNAPSHFSLDAYVAQNFPGRRDFEDAHKLPESVRLYCVVVGNRQGHNERARVGCSCRHFGAVLIPDFLKNSPVLDATPFRPRHGYNINQTAPLTAFGFPTPSAGELEIESVDPMGHCKRSCFPPIVSTGNRGGASGRQVIGENLGDRRALLPVIHATVVRARPLMVFGEALAPVSTVRRVVAGLALARRRVNKVARHIDVIIVVAGVWKSLVR